MDRRGDSHVGTLAWIAALVLDGAPLPADASIRNFQQGKVGYMADAVEQVLLLPKDMADLRSIRKHKVFLSLKKDLALVGFLNSLSLFLFFFFLFSNLHIYIYIHLFPFERPSNGKEIVNSSHRMMKDEEARSIAAVEAFWVADKKS